MKRRGLWGFAFLVVLMTWGSAQEIVPMAVSPGSASRVAVVGQICPTFSWTAVDWASKYRVAVFEAVGPEAPAYEQIAAMASPVLSHEVIGRALSWTPSAEERLSYGGLYVWYVQAADPSGLGRWSEGRVFKVVPEGSWDMEMERRMIKTLEKNGVSEDVTQRVLQDMRSEVVERAVGEFDLQGGYMTQGDLGVQGLEGTYNTFYGRYAGASTTTGNYNAFLGYGAVTRNTLGSFNIFIGAYAGYYNTTANDNTFLGYRAGLRNTTGADNTFLGFQNGYDNTTGYSNTSIGSYAGYSNTTGYHNTFLGRGAGRFNTAGADNTFLGFNAGYSNTTANNNTFIGDDAGFSNTTGPGNSFIGLRAGYLNTTGYNNTFLGRWAGYINTTGFENTYVGAMAGPWDEPRNEGRSNTFVGYNAGYNGAIGSYNTFVGAKSGHGELVNKSTCIGYNAGPGGICIGYDAGIVGSEWVPLGGELLVIDNHRTDWPLILGSLSSHILIFHGKVGISPGYGGGTHLLDVGQSGAYCDGGVWVDGSSRKYKENIKELSSQEALKAFQDLEPVKYNYKADKDEQNLGFIAEDVPELVAMKDRKGLSPMDLVAVLTKVVQEQQRTISELRNRVEKLEKKGKAGKND